MAAIQHGLYQSFPLKATKAFVHNLGPNGNTATHIFCKALALIAYFLTLPPTTAKWKQCAHCLKVSSSIVTDKTWEATLYTCNQDVDVMCLTIINTTIRESCKNSKLWCQKTHDKACNCLILEVTNSHLPNIDVDLQICKWISHCATDLKEEAKANATTKAAKDTQSIYKQQYNITHHALDKDLHKIRMHQNTLLAKACEDAADDLTALKAKLKMEKAQTRINLEQQEYFLGKAECHR